MVYMVNVGAAAVTGSASLAGADFGPTIIDTGTTQTFVPTAVLTWIKTSVSASAGYAAAFGSQTIDSQQCLTTTMTSTQLDAALPPFSLTFASGTPISISATRSYLFAQGGGQYCFALADSQQLFGSAHKVSLFGNTLLAGMLTVIDITNHKIGFAPQAGCAEASFARRPRAIRRPTLDPALAISSMAQ